MQTIVNLWNSDPNWTLWQSIWIGGIFLILNLFLCFVNWFLQKEFILECCFPKSQKKIKRIYNSYSMIDKLLLIRLVNDSKHISPITPLCLFINYVNILASVAELVGYIGCILTQGNGWANVLLFSGFIWIMVSSAISFIPMLLWVPSIRRRYGLKR